MKFLGVVDSTTDVVVKGRHAFWLPHLQLKIPFSWGGLLTKFRASEPGHDPADTLPHELAIMHALAAERMAPPVGDLVLIETLISDHPGAWHADPIGAWGYEMADATRLPPGRFSLERMRSMPIAGSEGAWGDVEKPGNVVNGYLVDVRRTAWDMLRWNGGALPTLPRPAQDLAELRARVHRDCQFPAGERAEAYQDFWVGDQIVTGQRRVAERAAAMGFSPRAGDSVLDIGCQAGGFLQLAERAGATRIAGAEVHHPYVNCARALARSCGQNINVRPIDAVRDSVEFLGWVRGYFRDGVDHLLLLSMEKHLGEREMFDLIDAIGARRTYVETNAVSEASPMKLWPLVQARGGQHVGDTTDRNLRRLYRIER